MENEIMNNVEEVTEQVIEVVADNDGSVLKAIAKGGAVGVGMVLLVYGIYKGVKFLKNKRAVKNNEIHAEYEVTEDESK